MIHEKSNSVKVPFILKDGKLEYFYGGEITKILKEGNLGEIVVSNYDLSDANVLKEIDYGDIRTFIPRNKQLFVAINPRDSVAGDLMNKVVDIPNKTQLYNYRFVQVKPMIDLKIKFRGMKQSRLENCPILIPALKVVGISLNHAYNLISRAFEPDRLSHSGNVFKMTLYEDELGFLKTKIKTEKLHSSFVTKSIGMT